MQGCRIQACWVGGKDEMEAQLPSRAKIQQRSSKVEYLMDGGSSYRGEWDNNLPNGTGLQEFPDGGRYSGSFVNGKACGWGVFEYACGSKYVGTWSEDLADGKGTLRRPDGWVYRGGFVAGKPHGEGTVTMQDGSTFVGQHFQGAKEGYGEHVHGAKDHGCAYKGQYANDVWHGKGVYIWPDGTKYDGEWHEGKRHGRGKLTYVNGHSYTGNFECNARHGRGTMEWSNGSSCRGHWCHGLQHGTGAYCDGQTATAGRWEMGVVTWNQELAEA